jgi:hypothetical protein
MRTVARTAAREGSTVTWTWRYESEDGTVVTPPGLSATEQFPTQGDAETWIGEEWRDLLEAGVAQVTLLEGDRKVYGPMSLHPTT